MREIWNEEKPDSNRNRYLVERKYRSINLNLKRHFQNNFTINFQLCLAKIVFPQFFIHILFKFKYKEKKTKTKQNRRHSHYN